MQKGFGLIGILIVISVTALVGGWYFWYVGSHNVMTFDTFAPCDIDRDEDCDADDFELVTNTIGQCESGDNYNELADADHDGCVTVADRRLLFLNEGEIDISTWKTYRNEEYGFEFKYPQEWELSDEFYNKFPLVVIGNPLEGPQWYSLNIFVENNPNGLTAKAYAEEIIKRASEEVERSGVGRDFISGKSEISINGLIGYRLYNVFEFDLRAEYIYLVSGQNAFKITFPIAQENPNLSNPVENNKIAYQILSTFKFVK